MCNDNKFSFESAGIKVGDFLTFTPANLTVKIIDEKRITFRGQTFTLSGFCRAYMPDEMRNPSNAYRGPLYFTFKGMPLLSLASGQQPQESEPQDSTNTDEKNTDKDKKDMSTQQGKQLGTNEAAAQIAAILANMQPKAPQGVNDELIEKVNEIVDEKLRKSRTITIKINEMPEVKTDHELHARFKKVLFWVNNNAPVYLFGPAGTGKSTLAKQVADALSLNFYSVSSLQQKFELEGFVDASGTYQETDFYKAFTGGGVFMLDEMDNTSSEVLIAFNNALANGYYTFPGKIGRVQANDNFRVIAAGNTVGRGASDAYNGRFQLDASTLDRFKFIKVDYDERIEMALANNDKELIEFIHALRDAIKEQGLTYTASTRAIRGIAVGMAGGVLDEKEVLQDALCGGWAKDDLVLLQQNLECNNEYAKIFKSLI